MIFIAMSFIVNIKDCSLIRIVSSAPPTILSGAQN